MQTTTTTTTTAAPAVRNITAVNGLAVGVAGLLAFGVTAANVQKQLQAAPLGLSATQAQEAVKAGQEVLQAQRAYRNHRTASRQERRATMQAVQEAVKAGKLQEAQALLAKK